MITLKSIPSYVCYAAVSSNCDKCTYSKNICKTQNQKWLSKRTDEDMILIHACMEELDLKNTQANKYLKLVLEGQATIVGRVVEKGLKYGVRT